MSWLLILLFIFASSLYSGLETGGYLLNRIRLRVRVRHGNRAALRLKRVLADAHLFVFTVLIGQNIAVYLVSREVTTLYMGADYFEQNGPLLGFVPWNAETAATLTLMLPLFILGEVLPKNLFRRRADTLMYRTSIPLYLSWQLFRPFTYLLKGFFSLVSGNRERDDAETLSLQGLREYFMEQGAHPALSEHQHGMISNLISMERIAVRDVMKSTASVSALQEDSSVQQALELMQKRGVDQLAVHGGSVRHLTGFISLFDLMDPSLSLDQPVRSLVRKTIRISADQPLPRALRRLRKAPGMPAFVTDRSSRTIGLLHLRDVAAHIASDA